MQALFKWEPPSWIDKEAWDAFVEMRKAKGKRAPFTDKARDRIIIELDRLRSQGNNPDEVLWQSVVNGWSGVFALKVDYQAAKQATVQREQQREQEKRVIAEEERTAMPAEVKAKLAGLIQNLRRH